MTNTDPKAEQTRFVDIAPSVWLNDDSVRFIIFEAYSTSISLFPEGVERAREVIDAYAAIIGDRFGLNFMTLHRETEFQTATIEWLYTKQGGRTLQVDLNNRKVKPAEYILLCAPIYGEGEHHSEKHWIERRDRIRGLLTAYFGHSAIGGVAFQVRIDPRNPDQTSFVTPPAESFLLPDVYFTSSPEDTITFGKRASIRYPPEALLRSQIALELLGTIVDQIDPNVRFMHAWLALEVVCGGYGKASALLEKIGTQTTAPTLRKLKYQRNQLFHHGVRGPFLAEDEMLLMKIIISKIMEPCNVFDKNMHAYLKSGQAPTIVES